MIRWSEFWPGYCPVCDGISITVQEEPRMTRYKVFDLVQLRQPVKLADGQVVPIGTQRANVDLFQGGMRTWWSYLAIG